MNDVGHDKTRLIWLASFKEYVIARFSCKSLRRRNKAITPRQTAIYAIILLGKCYSCLSANCKAVGRLSEGNQVTLKVAPLRQTRVPVLQLGAVVASLKVRPKGAMIGNECYSWHRECDCEGTREDMLASAVAWSLAWLLSRQSRIVSG